MKRTFPDFLSAKTRAELLLLGCILETNCFQLHRDDEENPQAALFKVACRMNHSCTPNVQGTWNEDRQCYTVHASTNISAGEEIFNTCIDHQYIPRERRCRSLEPYGFVCSCKACDVTDKDFATWSRNRADIANLVSNIELALKADHEDVERLSKLCGFYKNDQGQLDISFAISKINCLLIDEHLGGPDLLYWYAQPGTLVT